MAYGWAEVAKWGVEEWRGKELQGLALVSVFPAFSLLFQSRALHLAHIKSKCVARSSPPKFVLFILQSPCVLLSNHLSVKTGTWEPMFYHSEFSSNKASYKLHFSVQFLKDLLRTFCFSFLQTSQYLSFTKFSLKQNKLQLVNL